MPCTNSISGPLVIRYKGNDNGTRPISPCDSSNPYWISPDIWLDHPADTTINEATTRVSLNTTLKVLVRNIGGQPVNNVNVEAFVCDYTLGVGPASAIIGTGKFTGSVPTIGAGNNNTAVVSCAPVWTPTSAQLLINSGHVCMFANCFSDTDGQTVDTLSLDPVTHTLPFCCDSHLAQRNINIIPAAKGAGGGGIKNIRVEMMAANPSLDIPFTVSPSIRRVVGPAAITKNERWMLQTSPFITTAKVNGRNRFVLADQGHVRFTSQAAERKAALTPADVVALHLSRFRKFDYQFAAENIPTGRDIRIPLEPGESRPISVNLQLNADEAIGSMHTFDIVQATPDGILLGGVRVLVVIVP